MEAKDEDSSYRFVQPSTETLQGCRAADPADHGVCRVTESAGSQVPCVFAGPYIVRVIAYMLHIRISNTKRHEMSLIPTLFFGSTHIVL